MLFALMHPLVLENPFNCFENFDLLNNANVYFKMLKYFSFEIRYVYKVMCIKTKKANFSRYKVNSMFIL